MHIMSDQNGDLEILENFIVNNSDFEELKSLLSQFNIFEVLGAVRQEVRHSDFLSYLLNPQETHGLGDYFLRKFLQEVISKDNYEHLPFTKIDLYIWDLSDFQVRREWNLIDILLLSESLKLAVIIENKIDSTEHSNQLQRYLKIVDREYPGWNKLGVYLTPEGISPSYNIYFPISYTKIAAILEDIVGSRQTSLGPDVHTLTEHYIAMLRRHIVSGSKIEELCQKIYRKHQKALDMIYEYRPDLQSDIYTYLIDLINYNNSLTLDYSTKSYIRFFPNTWANYSALSQSKGWTDSKQILLFEFRNYQNSLKLCLIIGPGNEEIRKKLFNFALANKELLTPSRRQLTQNFLTIFQYTILTRKDYSESVSIDDVEPIIQKKWEVFYKNPYQKIISLIESQNWILDSED